MSKYDSLIGFLSNIKDSTYKFTFDEIEKIIGEKLPPSAYQYDAWWANDPSHVPMKQILEAGWRKTRVDFDTREVWLERINTTLFDKLKNFVLNGMRLQANYQPVMIMTLVLMGGSLSKETLAQKIQERNPDNSIQDFKQIPVYDVLINNGIVKQEGNRYVLNGYYDFTDYQKREIIELCEQKIQDYDKNKDKIAICWPTDNDDEKIDSFIDVIKRHGKALWGVNWSANRVQKNDFPIKGYLYYRKKIIAIATINSISDASSTSSYELTLKPENVDYSNNRYSNYLHIFELRRCEPFPHTVLQLMDPHKETPDVVQQRVYVKELQDETKNDFNVWIWSVTPENWEIVQSKQIWASRIQENIRTRVHSFDKVIFYVQGTGEFKGIYEFDGEWYDAKSPVWTEETNSVVYPSQIKLKLVKLGRVTVYDIASKLKLFPNPEDKRMINLVLKGGAGYPSNNGKPISYEDYKIILDAMRVNYLLLRYKPDGENKWHDEFGKKYHFGKIANYTKVTKGSKAVWFDKKDGEYYFLGYGEVDDIVQDENGEFLAIFNNFESFTPPKEATNSMKKQIEHSPGYNIQSSILEINEELYDEIVGNKIIRVSPKDIQLPTPTNEELEKGYAKISEELLVSKEKILEIVTALSSGSHVILTGSIGTGKTELARRISEIFWEKDGSYLSDVYTATADWNTRDVIGGIVPKMDGKNVTYEIQEGCITESVKKNWNGNTRSSYAVKGKDYRGVWAVIDEFNRADIDKAFGQLFTSLRTGELKIPTDLANSSYELLQIPLDFRIIGTLNTADKHYLFPLSNALKSRFAFIEIDIPDKKLREQEIFYAMSHAMKSLEGDYSSIINLDIEKRLIDGTDSAFLSVIYQAYNFLSYVRLFKKLGTAILKIIFQNLLTGQKMSINLNTVLDNAVNSIIIPQLEGLSQNDIGAIIALQNNSIVDYFKMLNASQRRTTAGDAFQKTLDYLEISEKIPDFTKNKIQNDEFWKQMENTIIQRKQKIQTNFATDLHQVTKSLHNLMENAVI